MEFFTGDALFQTHDNLEHLAMMEAVIGHKIDTKLVRQVVQGGRSGHQNQSAKSVPILPWPYFRPFMLTIYEGTLTEPNSTIQTKRRLDHPGNT